MQKFYKPLIVIYLLYVALALLVVTPALNYFPGKFVQDTYQRSLSARLAWFNPFTLGLEVRGLALTEHNGDPFLGFESASVNLSLSSLFRSGVVLDALRVKDLSLHAAMLGDGQFNFSDFLPPADDTPTSEEPAAIPGITIHELDLHAATIKLSDLGREKPWSSQWHDFTVVAQDLSTVFEEGKPYSIGLSNETGGELRWEGMVSIPQGESDGHLQISELDLNAFWRFAEPWVNFELAQGTLDVGASYKVHWLDQLAYSVEQGSINLNGLDLRPKQGVDIPDTQITLDKLAIEGIDVSGERLAVDVGRVGIDGLHVAGFSEGDRISLQELLTPRTDNAAEPEPEPTNPTDTDPGPSWQASLGQLQVSNSGIEWRSQFTEPALMQVTPITLQARDLSWPPAGSSALSLELAINERTQLAISGAMDLAQGDGQFDYKLAALYLPWFNPTLPEEFKVELGDGEIALDGSASIAGFAPTALTLNGEIARVAVKREDSDKVLSGLQRLSIDALALNLEQRDLALHKLTIDGLDGRLRIDEDGSINTSHLIAEPATPQPATPQPAADPDPEPKPELQPKPESEAPWEAAEPPWTINIDAIVLLESEIDFADDSLSKDFRITLNELEGEVRGLSSTAEEPAKVALTGSIDGSAPLNLAGTMKPLHSPPTLDIELDLRSVDMARFTPYTGTYTGYAIERGLLDADFDYQVQDNRLQGDNAIVIKKIKLSEKRDKDAPLDIPVDLAVSLLTDSNGVFKVNVPLSGDLNDPQFELGQVFISAFAKVLMSAVTSPFSVLAGLVGSEDDFQNIVFAAGSAELDDHNKGILGGLQDALAQRPKLSLVLAGQLHPEEDRKRAQRNALKQQLNAAGLPWEDIEQRSAAWEKVVNRRFEALEGSPADASLSVRDKYRALTAATEIDESSLDELIAARAEAVRSYLVDEKGLPAERVEIDQGRLNPEVTPISGVKLFLDN